MSGVQDDLLALAVALGQDAPGGHVCVEAAKEIARLRGEVAAQPDLRRIEAEAGLREAALIDALQRAGEARGVVAELAAELEAALVRIGEAESRALHAERHRNGLLAVIHRDGGHHTGAVGEEQSWQDGMKAVSDLLGWAEEAEQVLVGAAAGQGLGRAQELLRAADAALGRTGKAGRADDLPVE